MSDRNETSYSSTISFEKEKMVLELTKDERSFLIACILMAANEGFYLLDRRCENYSYDDILDLFKRLGASKEEVEDLEYA